MQNRPGFSLTELLVGLVVASLIGASVVQLMTVQSRFFSAQDGRSNARAVSRSATNIMITELRLIEPVNGMLAADRKSVSVRVPFAVGIVCGSTASKTTVILTPPDSIIWQEGIDANLIDGYGWRNSDTNPFTIYGGTISLTDPSTSGLCASAVPPLTPPAGAKLVDIGPSAAGSQPGARIYLYQRITYSLANSVSVPGEVGLWRTYVNKSQTEEIAAPFDTAAHFEFYVNGSNTPQAAVPADLTTMTGLELRLTARNERTPSRVAAELTPLTTAVFFKNR
jgi:prepilin-type N-terminal cleavage/methylation domain-containing protein